MRQCSIESRESTLDAKKNFIFKFIKNPPGFLIDQNIVLPFLL